MDAGSIVWLLGTLFVSLAGGALGYLGVQWQHRHHLRNFERWLGDLEDRAHEVIRTDARAAGAKGELFELMGKIPDDFDPTIFLTCKVGEGLQRSVLLEAERRGFVVVGTFERVFGLPDIAAAHPPAPHAHPQSQVIRPQTLFESGPPHEHYQLVGIHPVKQPNGANGRAN